MRRVNTFLLLVLTGVLLFGATAGDAQASPQLTLLGSTTAEQMVTLSPTGEQLRGSLSVPILSAVTGRPEVSYYPSGNTTDTSATTVEIGGQGAQHLRSGHATSLQLAFAMPATAAPHELNGVVEIEVAGRKAVPASPLLLSVTGSSALTGVTVQPEQLKIQTTDSSPSADVQFFGPGVPDLFRKGAKRPSFRVVLHSDNGDEATARLTGVRQSATDPNSAQGTVKIEGGLASGKYEGSTPISSLSPEAPKLTLTIESGDPFVYALVMVSLGTLAGGFLYLTSGRRRRKDLFRDQVNSILDIYEKKLAELKPQPNPDDNAKTVLPVKSLEKYLGPKENWHRVKWNAIVEFDGAVQAIWSAIHWARDENDLNEVGQQIDTLRGKAIRWVRIANCVDALECASRLKPDELVGKEWHARRVRRDTGFLLQWIREIEPTDDQTAQSLEDRIFRQAHWHTVLARAWHARTVLERAMNDDPGHTIYDTNTRQMIQELKLEDLDKDASPESGRSAEKQIELEQELGDFMEKIALTYKGDPADLKLPGGAMPVKDGSETMLPVAAASAVYGQADLGMEIPAITDAERERVPHGTNAGRGGASKRDPHIVREILFRDAISTIAIAVATSAAYAATLYTGTWGTTTDYVSAFTAGFLGKVVVNWAALPLFQSLRSTSTTAPTATDAKTEPTAAAPVTVPTGSAVPPDGKATPATA